MAGTLGIDPQLDIAGRIGNECFICAHPIRRKGDLSFFGVKDDRLPQLPCHLLCLEGRDPATVAILYHERIADLADVARVN